MLQFTEWLLFVELNDQGFQHALEGLNQEFKKLLSQTLSQNRFSTEKVKQEAMELLADKDNSLFNFAQMCLQKARSETQSLGGNVFSRSLKGQDIEHATQQIAGDILVKAFDFLREPGKTFEERNKTSLVAGIRGAMSSFAGLWKKTYLKDIRTGADDRSGGPRTATASQMEKPGAEKTFNPLDAGGVRDAGPEEYDIGDTLEGMKRYVISQIKDEIAAGGKDKMGGKGSALLRHLQTALTIINYQKENPQTKPADFFDNIPELVGTNRRDQMVIRTILADAYKQVTESFVRRLPMFVEWLKVRMSKV